MTPKQKREAAMLKQQNIVNAAKAEGNRALTAEEQAEFNRCQLEIEQADAEMKAEERELIGRSGETTPTQVVNPQFNSSQMAEQTTPVPAEEQRNAAEEERNRATEIIALCRDFDVDPAEYIQNGSSLDQVRSTILADMRQTGTPVRVQVTRDEADTFKQRTTDALMLRAGMSVEHPVDGANQLRSMSLRDIGIECLSREGYDTMSLLRMQPDEMYVELCRQSYNPSAVFPAILDNTIRKSIVELYNSVPTTFEAITTKGTLKDFKQTADYEYVIGGVGD